jgi:hypothetical protein
MARNPRLQNPTAIITLKEPKVANGIKRDFDNRFRSSIEDGTVITGVERDEKTKETFIAIAGDISEKAVEEFVADEEKNTAFMKKPKEIGINFVYYGARQESQNNSETGAQESRSPELGNLYAEINRLKTVVQQGEERSKEFSDKYQKANADAEHFVKKNIEHEAEIGDLKSRLNEASSDVARWAEKYSKSEKDNLKISKELKEMKERGDKKGRITARLTLLDYLSKVAEQLPKIEAIVGNKLYEAKPASNEALVKKVRSLGLKEEVNTIDDVFNALNKYFNNTDAEQNLNEEYRKANSKSAKGYESKAEEIRKIEEGIQKMQADSGMPEEITRELIAVLNKKLDERKKEIAEYDTGLKQFKENVCLALMECEEELQKSIDLCNTTESIAEDAGFTQLPVYVCLSRDREFDYHIDIFLPLKAEQSPEGVVSQKSNIYDLILCENVFTESVKSRIGLKELKDVKKNCTSDGLFFYSLVLPEKEYSLDRVLEIKDNLQKSIIEAYEGSPLKNIGINMDVILHNYLEDMDKRDEYSGVPVKIITGSARKKEAAEPEALNLSRAEKIQHEYETVRNIIAEADAPVSSSEVSESFEKILGYPIKRETLRKKFVELMENGEIKRDGDRGGARYSLKPKQESGGQNAD